MLCLVDKTIPLNEMKSSLAQLNSAHTTIWRHRATGDFGEPYHPFVNKHDAI